MKNNASMIFVLAAASILLHTGSGDAAPTVSLELSGQVTEISAIGFGGRDDSLNFQSVVPFEVGDPVTGRVSWDPTVFPTPLNGGLDFRPGNFLLRVGATDFTAEQISINTSFPRNPSRLQVTPGNLNFLPDGWSSDFSGRLASSALTLRDDIGEAFADNSPRLETSPTAADLDSIDFVIYEDLGFHTWITP